MVVARAVAQDTLEGMRAALGLFGLAATLCLAPSCARPTAVRLDVFSEVDCAKNAPAVLVTAGALSELGASAPSASSTKCEAGNLGSVVVSPSGARDGVLSLAMMTRPDGQSADGCLDPKTANGCIVAKRRLRFEPKTEIAMRIDLRLSCLNVACPDDQTCVRGACVSADITCGDTCDESALLQGGIPDADAGLTPADGGAPDGAPSVDAGVVDAGPPPAPPLVPLAAGPYASTAAAIAVGEDHACVLLANGQVGCFGGNAHGQLGDGTFTPRNAPGQVLDLPPASALAAGDGFTCAILVGGGVSCWGTNDRGQLGDGSIDAASASPRAVAGTLGAASLSVGAAHACATRSLGVSLSAHCWGANDFGQLGPAATGSESRTPVLIPGVGGISLKVAAGRRHSCAGGKPTLGPVVVWCWGDNTSGQLGDGTTTSRPTPAPSSLGIATAIESVAAGSASTCAVVSSTLLCWGANDQGQVADGTAPIHVTPFSAGVVQTASSTQDGGSVITTYTPTFVTTGDAHGCQLPLPGQVLCWGRNHVGQLGLGLTGNRQVQTLVPGLTDVTAVSAYGSSTCVLDVAGIRCFGKLTADFPADSATK